MGRIVGSGDTPSKRRSAHERSCAEVLRRLAERSTFDEEALDMAAFLVFSLRGIYATIDESAGAWDDRDYWRKAEALREKYRWAQVKADELEALLKAGSTSRVPDFLISIVPHFAHVTVVALTRDADWWCGAWKALARQAGANRAGAVSEARG